MAKNKVPKKIAGYKVPRAIRQSTVIKTLLASEIGRGILANALTAAAGAAATVLVAERGEIADATSKGARTRALNIAGAAMGEAAHAAMDVVRSTAHDALPKKLRKDVEDRPRRGAVH
jgi:hypothetical protein